MSQTNLHMAVLFADISGSTRLYEQLGNTAAQRIIAQALNAISDVTSKQGGRVVKSIGDEIMCTFVSPEVAADSAVIMQETMKKENAAGSFGTQTISLRIGFEFGPVVLKEADVFGDAVNVAARVVAQAKAREILTTNGTRNMLPVTLRARSRFVDNISLKGINSETKLFEVMWESENITMVELEPGERKRDAGRLHLRYRVNEYTLTHQSPPVQFGRGEGNDIMVPDGFASRNHARIEFRRDRFVLVDQSINGTYVCVFGSPEEFIRRSEYPLKGSGMFSLGRSTTSEAAELIHFTCESLQ